MDDRQFGQFISLLTYISNDLRELKEEIHLVRIALEKKQFFVPKAETEFKSNINN